MTQGSPSGSQDITCFHTAGTDRGYVTDVICVPGTSGVNDHYIIYAGDSADTLWATGVMTPCTAGLVTTPSMAGLVTTPSMAAPVMTP